MEFIMIDIILWYILMVGRVYLEVGLVIAFILWIITFNNDEVEKVTLKELVFTIFFHPIVIYYFIKELNGNNRRH